MHAYIVHSPPIRVKAALSSPTAHAILATPGPMVACVLRASLVPTRTKTAHPHVQDAFGENTRQDLGRPLKLLARIVLRTRTRESQARS